MIVRRHGAHACSFRAAARARRRARKRVTGCTPRGSRRDSPAGPRKSPKKSIARSALISCCAWPDHSQPMPPGRRASLRAFLAAWSAHRSPRDPSPAITQRGPARSAAPSSNSPGGAAHAAPCGPAPTFDQPGPGCTNPGSGCRTRTSPPGSSSRRRRTHEAAVSAVVRASTTTRSQAHALSGPRPRSIASGPDRSAVAKRVAAPTCPNASVSRLVCSADAPSSQNSAGPPSGARRR